MAKKKLTRSLWINLGAKEKIIGNTKFLLLKLKNMELIFEPCRGGWNISFSPFYEWQNIKYIQTIDDLFNCLIDIGMQRGRIF